MALGATLYSPATRPVLADDVLRSARRGVKSMVLCLEDAIGDDEVEAAEANLVAQLRLLHGTVGDGPEVPLLFIRVRDPRQIGDLIGRLGDAAALVSGFVLPKFTPATGGAFLDAVEDTAQRSGLRLLAMP